MAPSTAYSNRHNYNSSSLIWFSTGHNFIIIFLFAYIEKNIERFRSNSVNYKQDPHGKYSDPHSSLNSSPPNTFLLTALASSHVSFSYSCPSAHQDYSLLALLKPPLLSYQVSHFLFSFILLITQVWASSPFSFICLHSPYYHCSPLLALKADKLFTIWSGQNPSHSYTNQPAVQTAKLNPVARRISPGSEDLNKHYILKQTLIYPHNSKQIRIW